MSNLEILEKVIPPFNIVCKRTNFSYDRHRSDSDPWLTPGSGNLYKLYWA